VTGLNAPFPIPHTYYLSPPSHTSYFQHSLTQIHSSTTHRQFKSASDGLAPKSDISVETIKQDAQFDVEVASQKSKAEAAAPSSAFSRRLSSRTIGRLLLKPFTNLSGGVLMLSRCAFLPLSLPVLL
jgi:hypothetical protein